MMQLFPELLKRENHFKEYDCIRGVHNVRTV